jgi:broad specificity phosphatase PhoE
MSQTHLYLVRHGATAANLSVPPKLLGRNLDPPLAPPGFRQAEEARAALSGVSLGACYCSPLRRAVQTAAVIATPRGLTLQLLEALIECDLGRWEGLDWPAIRDREPDAYDRFHADPARNAHPAGESYGDVYERVSACLNELLERHRGQAVLVVTHHVVLRTYLAILAGLPLSRAREVSIANGAISTVINDGSRTRVLTLADTGHAGETGGDHRSASE